MSNFITRTPFHQVTGIQPMNPRGGTIIDDVYVFDTLHINQLNNNGGVSRVMNTTSYHYMGHANNNITRVIRVNPASKHSIENLQRFRVEEASNSTTSSSSSMAMCSICLEVLLHGSEATRMPCSHVYHNDCINEWLNKCNTCPLCRRAI